MHQDSKTFSDLTAIDTRIVLELQIEIATYGDPQYAITINGIEMRGEVILYRCGLFDPIEISCSKSEPGTVTIEKLSINNKEVLPRYGHLTSNQKHWITETTWHLSIPSNFYQWYHEVSGQGWIA